MFAETKSLLSERVEPVESLQGFNGNFKGVEVVVETQAERSHMGWYPICDGPAVKQPGSDRGDPGF